MQSSPPGSGTPTADAINTAATYLATVRAATTARSIILATDGAPNCNPALPIITCTCTTENEVCGDPTQCLDNVRTVNEISAVLAQGIPTYVIGIANDDADQFTSVLNAMAIAGGRPLTSAATSYYPALDGADLEAAITTIRNEVAECTYLTTSVPGESGSIVVTLNGQTLPFAGDGGSAGWSWANEANGEITLVGSTCDDLAADAGVSLVAHVECGH